MKKHIRYPIDVYWVCFVFISGQKNHKKKDTYTLSQGLKLAGATGILIAGTEHISTLVNKRAFNMTTKDYLNGVFIGGLMIGSGYGAFSLFVPMWREITEYRPDESPFLKMSSYLDIPHPNLNDDVYS